MVAFTFIPPQLPTLSTEPPTGPEWLHEIKHDGYRTLVAIDHGNARAFTRNGYDWTAKYAPILKACAKLRCQTALIDGEMVVENEHGISDFAALRSAIESQPSRLVFFAFDLLWLNGENLRSTPLIERRAKLQHLIREPCSSVRYSEHFTGDGAAFFKAAVEHGLEGIVSKYARSHYRSGPSKVWLKTKNMIESEFVVIGIEKDLDGKQHAHLARETNNDLEYAGMALLTLPEPLRREFIERSSALAATMAALKLGRRRAQWIKPEMVVSVRHLQGGGPLRHATVKSITDPKNGAPR